MWKRLGLVCLTSLVSCAHAEQTTESSSPPPPPSYTVVIDSHFASNEQTEIANGFDAWQTAVGPDLNFAYLTADRVDIDAVLAGTPPARTIYALEVADISLVGCVLQAELMGCFVPPNRVYFEPDIIISLGVWPKITAHEAGHAIGMQHSGVPFSVMQSQVVDMSTHPLPSDADQYCSQQPNGCPHRKVDAGN